MAIEYRLLNSEEIEQIYDLWVEVYPETQRESWKQEFLSIPGSLEHTYVAVDHGRVVSTALVWIRAMNDAAGIVQRIGNVSHVATHPAARRRGHARRLLDLAIAHLEQENCDYSTLFTSEEGRPLYEHMGWQTCLTYCWQGKLTGFDIPQSNAYVTHTSLRMDEPSLWQTLSEIYTEFNKALPFAVQRDVSTWKSFTAHKITDWVQAGASVWLASPVQSPEAISGYLIAHCSDQGFMIAELGVKEGHRAAILNLLNAVMGAYNPRQQVWGRVYLPNEPDIVTLLQQCLNPIDQIESKELMVRLVNPQKDLNRFIGPGLVWVLDQI